MQDFHSQIRWLEVSSQFFECPKNAATSTLVNYFLCPLCGVLDYSQMALIPTKSDKHYPDTTYTAMSGIRFKAAIPKS